MRDLDPAAVVLPDGRKSKLDMAVSEIKAHPNRWGEIVVYPTRGTASSTAAKLRKKYPGMRFVVALMPSGGFAVGGMWESGMDEDSVDARRAGLVSMINELPLPILGEIG